MKEIVLNIIFVLCPMLLLSFPIIGIIAVSKLDFLFHEDLDKAGFELNKNLLGSSRVSFKDAKKILKLTKDEYTKSRAKESVQLWKISYSCLFSGLFLLLLILWLQ